MGDLILPDAHLDISAKPARLVVAMHASTFISYHALDFAISAFSLLLCTCLLILWGLSLHWAQRLQVRKFVCRGRSLWAASLHAHSDL